MGTKPVFKRYKNLVYLTGCIVISLFLFGCQHTAQPQSRPTSIDRNEKKYLVVIHKLVLNKDFEAAAAENRLFLKDNSQNADINDMVSSNSAQNAEIIFELLTRIMEDEYRERTLSRVIESTEEQIRSLTLSKEFFENKAGALEKKMVDMDRLSEKVKNLEKEKKLLQQQIDQLKKIDLNLDPVGSKQTVE